MKRKRPFLELDTGREAALIQGARDTQPVSGLTHNFYRYPARFSPAFVRAVIETFTRPGDLVLDPHVGGGTSLVEAMALGRHAVGVDISQLAQFVSEAKTCLYGEAGLSRLRGWAKRLPDAIDIHRASTRFEEYAEAGYYRHLDHPTRWRLRKAIEQALAGAERLHSERIESLARCVVLRTAQWALDGRRNLPSVVEFRDMLVENAEEMITGARELRAAARRHAERSRIAIIQASAAGIEEDERLKRWPTPRLVVTSPPYPGIHVLYHRWQVDGRKETPAPFWIAGKLDGAGSSYYTMGDRKYPELATYFANVLSTMSSVAAVCDERTAIVQMVAFSDASWQLPRYLETMEETGLEEVFLPALRGKRDGRLWRRVPNRRWYSDQRGETPGSQEVVLVHRKKTEGVTQPRRRSRIEVRKSQ